MSFNTNNTFYYTFISLCLIEVLTRSHIQLPPLSFAIAFFLYFWIYKVTSYIINNPRKISNFNGVWSISLLSACNISIIIRGIYDSNDYWDYKEILLNKGPLLLLPISIFLTSELKLIKRIYNFILKYYIWISLVAIKPVFFSNTGRIMCSAIPLFFFWNKKYKYTILFFLTIAIPAGWDARGWVLRAIFGILLMIIYVFNNNSPKIRQKIYESIYYLCILLPLLFIFLGYTGRFNIFALDENIQTGNKKELADTRSFLYQQVQYTLETENKTWIGLGGKSEYWKYFFYNNTNENDSKLKKKGRSSTESGLLNMYLYGGWIGVSLFSLLFWTSAYYGIFKSRNQVCKLTGCFIIFRWVISFVDEPEAWICSNLMLFFTMGICLNMKIRQLSDYDWKRILQTIR